MRRDEELNRLIKYAQGIGVKSVKFKPYTKGGNEAEWALDGSEIIIYVTKKTSKLAKILSLIHELSHHRAYIDDGRTVNPKIEDALDKEHLKAARKKILDMEISDSAYWLDIYRDADCKFNVKKLHKQKEYDLWQYEVFYETSKYPTKKEKIAKRKELRKKYGC